LYVLFVTGVKTSNTIITEDLRPQDKTQSRDN